MYARGMCEVMNFVACVKGEHGCLGLEMYPETWDCDGAGPTM